MPTPILAASLCDLPGIRHGFFTREGGVSEGLYRGLNCGSGSKDEAACVAENRARVALHLGAPAPEVLTPYQIHSADAVIVDGPFPAHAPPPRGDALVTRARGLAIGILTADCGPVLLADASAGVVAAAHAGWRGAAGGILEATVAAMEYLGARRDGIHAVLGPCITQPNYEVGDEFEAGFITRDPAFARYFVRPAAGARPHFDLPAFVLDQLAGLGLASVENCVSCTYTHSNRYFSFRRATHLGEADYGRQISAILVA